MLPTVRISLIYLFTLLRTLMMIACSSTSTPKTPTIMKTLVVYATTIIGLILVGSELLVVTDAFSPQQSSTIRTSTTASTTSSTTTTTTTALNLRVAYQGEPGAYSEKSTRELLGNNVIALGKPNFEACFRAVASMEVDYCCLPIENSLGGSIHENYDLMLRYDLTICAEHEFRVQHCVLAKEGVELPGINGNNNNNNNNDGKTKTTIAKYAISHPQALAQCDNYLRALGITPIPTYDTAGSAKMIRDDDLPALCTPENTIAIGTYIFAFNIYLNIIHTDIQTETIII